MPDLPLTVGHYGRPRVGLPSQRLVNCFPEATKEGPSTAARIPRPGLTRWGALGVGPIQRLYQNPGLFNGDLFTISAGQLYRGTSSLGAIPYGTQPRMDAANDQLAVVSGGQLYVYDGTTLSLIQYFDDGSSRLPPFSSVCVLFNIFIYTVAGSGQFFFSQVGDATSINAANFSTAQTSPDPILEVATLADELYFFGSRSVEPWDFEGSLTAPFALAQGRTYSRGLAAQGSVVKLDNALFWIGDDLSVYRSGAVPQKVSTPFIDDVIREGAAFIDQTYGFSVGVEGHRFYVVNLPLSGSWAFDVATEEWAQWGSANPFQDDPTSFIGQCSAGEGAQIYVGSNIDGRVWILDPTNATDDGVTKRVICSGAIWTEGGKQRLNSIGLQCVRGVGTPSAPAPHVQMRLSKDGGRTWGVWLNAQLGAVGQYAYKAVWRGLGLISQPGVAIEFSVEDPVNFVVEGAAWNEARY
jgi:hypothetical protein